MTEVALNELQKQIEAIRREAFAEGYAAAMAAVRELTSRSASRSNGGVAAPSGNGSSEGGAEHPEPGETAVPLRTNNAVRRGSAERRRTAAGRRTAAAGNRRSREGRAQRGTNARMIEQILKSAAPRTVRQADIRKALHEKGISLAFTSIRHALGQLQARKLARHGKSGTWRYSAAA